jgi:hypothetical protein
VVPYVSDAARLTSGWQFFDKGYFKHLLAGGSFIYLLSSFLLSLAKPHNFYQNFLAQGVGMGIGMGESLMYTIARADCLLLPGRHLIFALYLHTSPLLQATPRSCHGDYSFR